MTKKQFYKTILSFFTKRKFSFILFLILGGLNLVFGLIEPFFSAQLLTGITSLNLKNILLFAFLFMLLALGEQFFRYIQREQRNILENKISLDMKAFISKILFALEQKNFDEKGTSFFGTRMNRDTEVGSSILACLEWNLSSVLHSFGVLIYIFILNIPLGCYILITSGMVYLFRLKSVKVREKRRKLADDEYEKYNSDFVEIIRGIRDIKALNLKKEIIDKITKEQEKIYEIAKKNRRGEDVWSELEWAMKKIFDFGCLAFAVYLVTKNVLLGANLIILYTYKNEAFHFLNSISYFYENMVDIRYTLNRLYELMDEKLYSQEHFGKVHLKNVKGDLIFTDVSFTYKEEPVLKNISFHIESKATVGFVGKSGAGKSTLFQLISKLYSQNAGEILIDGIPISNLDEETIRSNISFITQNPYLFNMTIRENLKIVNPKATESEMIKNCKLCAFHDYVMSLPKGYDTFIGEGGVILSGGLRQRLAIARALMKKSKIILLDEATSSLDNETQDFIKNSIQKISADYTILIIAHRLSTVKDCERLFVIDEGQIVGEGTHEELIKNNKFYKKLYKHELE